VQTLETIIFSCWRQTETAVCLLCSEDNYSSHEIPNSLWSNQTRHPKPEHITKQLLLAYWWAEVVEVVDRSSTVGKKRWIWRPVIIEKNVPNLNTGTTTYMHAPIYWSLSSEPKLTGCPVILRMAGTKFLYVPECHPDIKKSPISSFLYLRMEFSVTKCCSH